MTPQEAAAALIAIQETLNALPNDEDREQYERATEEALAVENWAIQATGPRRRIKRPIQGN